MSEHNKAVVERLTRELFNDGGRVDLVDELLSPDFVDHTPPRHTGADREGFKQRAITLRAAFSDVRTRSEQLVAEGDLVCERYSCSFRHTGDFGAVPPSGSSVEIRGFAIYRVRDGRVVESWSLSDGLGLLQQIGAVSAELEGSEMQ